MQTTLNEVLVAFKGHKAITGLVGCVGKDDIYDLKLYILYIVHSSITFLRHRKILASLLEKQQKNPSSIRMMMKLHY